MLYLWASELALEHPTRAGERLRFTSPPPPAFDLALASAGTVA